ncbi:hypothetical protein CPC08DRAFT_536752 [Agrocybe pediades]|nr:hypothetical protein CPC08DRAFT_536752 [Agrocybe pediades]
MSDSSPPMSDVPTEIIDDGPSTAGSLYTSTQVFFAEQRQRALDVIAGADTWVNLVALSGAANSSPLSVDPRLHGCLLFEDQVDCRVQVLVDQGPSTIVEECVIPAASTYELVLSFHLQPQSGLLLYHQHSPLITVAKWIGRSIDGDAPNWIHHFHVPVVVQQSRAHMVEVAFMLAAQMEHDPQAGRIVQWAQNASRLSRMDYYRNMDTDLFMATRLSTEHINMRPGKPLSAQDPCHAKGSRRPQESKDYCREWLSKLTT